MDHLAHSLLGVYAGRLDVYGRQHVATSIDATGAVKRRATWTTAIAGPVTEELVRQHLAGKITLGLYLLHPDSSCQFAVWDIDSTERAPVTLLLRACDDLGIDVLLSDSGSKGFHLTAAFAEPVPGEVAWAFARAVWERAGRPEHVETFPKQAAVSAAAPYGNLIKLPLGIHAATRRRCALLTHDGTPLLGGTEADELDGLRRVARADVERVAALASTRVTPVTQVTHGAQAVTASGFVRVPYPCFGDLSTARYREGERNTLLFTAAKHLYAQGQPEPFAELVVGTQAERALPPYDAAEAREIVANVYTRGWRSLGCETQEMAQFCKGAVCPIWGRSHTIASGSVETPVEGDGMSPAESEAPAPRTTVLELENLVQIGLENPIYEATVCGKLITNLSVDDLYDRRRFERRIIPILQFIPELPAIAGKRADAVWRILVNDALSTVTLEERPGNAGPNAEIMEAVLEYLDTGVERTDNRLDVLRGSTWDGEDGSVLWRHFLPKHVFQMLRRRGHVVTQRELYGLLRAHGAQGVNVRIEARQYWLWRLPVSVVESEAC